MRATLARRLGEHRPRDERDRNSGRDIRDAVPHGEGVAVIVTSALAVGGLDLRTVGLRLRRAPASRRHGFHQLAVLAPRVRDEEHVKL